MEHIFAVGILNRYSDTKCSILVFKRCIFRLALSHKLKETNKQTNETLLEAFLQSQTLYVYCQGG